MHIQSHLVAENLMLLSKEALQIENKPAIMKLPATKEDQAEYTASTTLQPENVQFKETISIVPEIVNEAVLPCSDPSNAPSFKPQNSSSVTTGIVN